MQEKAQLPEYYKYLTIKFRWPQNTTDQIEWQVIKLAMNRFTPPDRIRIRIIIHEWIPTQVSPGNNPSKETDHLCPSCRRYHKTPEHILCCDAPNRCPHLAALRAKLVTLFTSHQIDPYVYQMWWLGLTTLNNPANPANHHMGLYPAQYQLIHSSQSKIGWKHLYYGCLTKQWTHFLTMNHPEINAAKFFAKLLQEAWIYELEIWKTRNANQTIATANIPPNMWSDIQGIFAAKDRLPQSAQDRIFNLTKEELALKPKPYIQAWINNSKNYIRNELRIQTKQQ